MKKKFILLALTLLTLLGGVNLNVLNAQETVTIGSIDANNRHAYMPFGTYNYISTSQQIYTSDQIGQSGTINEISFYRFSGGISDERLIDIYMINTSKDSFTENTDWVSLSDNDKVCSVSLANSLGEGLVTFKLDTPFEYTGENLLICFNVKHNNYWTNNNYFAVFNTDNTRALCKYSDNTTSYDPSNMTGSGNAYNKLNYIELNITPAITDGIVPAAPTELEATAIDHKSISLTWTAGDEYALKYNIYQNGIQIGSTSDTYHTVEGLTSETNYCFTVEAVRGGNVSESHSNEACATTLEAPADPLVGKQFRLKALTYIRKYGDNIYYGPYEFGDAKYLHIVSNNAAGLQVLDKTDSNAQRFTFEPTGVENQYYLRSADGYYINCAEWDVSAYDASQKSPIEVVYLDDTQTQFYLTNGTGRHFKVETGYNDGVTFKPYCDAVQQYAAKWIVEEVAFSASANAGEETIYDDQTTTLNVTAMDGSGNYTYNWTPADGLNNATSANPTFTPATTGEYTFTCTVTDTDNNTTAEASVTVYVNPRPALQLTVSADKDLIYNDGETTTLTANPTDGYAPYTYSWTLEENEVGTDKTYDFINATAGEYTFTCTVTDARGNTQTVSKTIEVKDASERPITRKVVFVLKEQKYQDGWDSGYLQVTIEDGKNEKMILESGYAEQSYTLEIAVGSTVNVDFYIGQWGHSGSDKDSYTIMYEDGTLIYDSSIELTSTGNYTHYYYEFTVERPAPKNLVANPSQIYPDQTTTISWEAYKGAASYNIYVNGTFKDNTTESSYELSDLAYNMNPGNKIEVVAVDENDTEISGKASVTVQVAGTFTLTVNVKDNKGNAIEGATVSVTTDGYTYDEFGNHIASLEPVTTDADGKAIFNDVKLLNPNTYCAYSISATKSLYGTHTTTPVTNYIDVQNGQNYEAEIVMTLPAPKNVTADKDYYDEGENVVLTWESPFRALIGYNVYGYKYGEDNYEEQINQELVQDLTYTIENVAYGMNYAVTAVYDEGESEKADANIQVLGKGILKVTVTDGVNPIAGATVNVSGYEYNETFTTNESGVVEESVYVGYYEVTASKLDTHYEATESNNADVTYEATSEVEIVLTAKPEIADDVTVTADNNGNVSWTGDYTKWNVYRRNTSAPQELTPVAKELETTSTIDAAWETLDPGTYQYGVSALVEPQAQTRGTEVIFEEGFESGKPEGWNVSGDDLNWKQDGANQPNSLGVNSIYNQGSWSGESSYLISPQITVKNAKLSFWHFNQQYDNSGQYTSVLKVYYSTNPEGPWIDENKLYESQYTSSWTNSGEIDLSSLPSKVYLAFCHEYNWGNGLYLDDLVITGEVSSEVETQIVWSNYVVKQGPNTFEGTVSTDWNLAENWSHGNAPEAGDEVIVNAEAVISSDVKVSTLDIVGNGSVTVDANASLTVSGKITQEKDYSLIMNDGAQVFQNNANVTAQFNMNLVNPSDWSTSNKDGWQFISSPLSNVSVTNIAEGNYDLYKYDGDAESELEWLNHKDENFADATYQHHIGYLASHETMSTLEFKGTLNYNDYYGSYAFYDYVQYYENEPLKNFYLIGNPYPFNISWADFKNSVGIYDGYAYVKNDGNYEYATSGTIAPGDGFFVKATGVGDYGTYYYYLEGSGNTRSTKASNNSLNITATGNAGEDNVIINLAGKSEGFDKLQNFNDAIATVYVAEDGKNYGIYNCDADVQEVELSFNANQMGNYTISIEPNGKFQTVTLVDRFTGIETNMLVEDYHFTAMSNVNTNRFIVRMVNGQESTDNSHFVYQSGEELILNIQGEVQIVDVLGRVVYSGEAMNDINRINVSAFNSGAYMVKVINGNEVKVEKIIL